MLLPSGHVQSRWPDLHETTLACDADERQVLAVGPGDGIDGAEPAHSEGSDDDTDATRPCVPIRCSALHVQSMAANACISARRCWTSVDQTSVCNAALRLTCIAGVQLIAAPHKAQPLLLDQLVQEDQVEVACTRGVDKLCWAAPIIVMAARTQLWNALNPCAIAQVLAKGQGTAHHTMVSDQLTKASYDTADDSLMFQLMVLKML